MMVFVLFIRTIFIRIIRITMFFVVVVRTFFVRIIELNLNNFSCCILINKTKRNVITLTKEFHLIEHNHIIKTQLTINES